MLCLIICNNNNNIIYYTCKASVFSRGFVVNILLFYMYSKECHIKKKGFLF